VKLSTAVWDVLARWGQRDQAKALLRRSIASPGRRPRQPGGGPGQPGDPAQDEGKLDEALATYQAVYDTFTALDAKQQMAAVLAQMSSVYQMKGDLTTAVARQEESLRLREEIGDEEGQAISLHQLAMLYHLQADYPAALARSQAAEKLDRKAGIEAHVAATLHEQGLIYNLWPPRGDPPPALSASKGLDSSLDSPLTTAPSPRNASRKA
jgi:tetratricopeptide (TPR) repeat protein